jgi:hypothetical protein
MSAWRIRHKDTGRDAQSTPASKDAAIVQALHLERRQHCRIQIIEGPNGELIDRETFEHEQSKKAAVLIAPCLHRFEKDFQAEVRP